MRDEFCINANGARHEKLISLKVVAAMFDVTVRTFYRLVAAGKIPAPLKVGRLSRYRASDVAEILKNWGK